MNILLLGDITGRGRVAVRAMMQTLEARGHEVYALPTALISNTLNLGRVAMLDTTDYLLRALEVWKELGMRFDCVCVGFVTGMPQARELCGVADRFREQGTPVLVDPILGDHGHMYNFVTEGQAAGMRLLVEHADLITPNLTEAHLLAGRPADGAQPPEGLASRLASSTRSVLITGCPGASEKEGVIVGCAAPQRSEIRVTFERLPGNPYGTGDLFSALLVDALLRGCALDMAARQAGEGVSAHLRGRDG